MHKVLRVTSMLLVLVLIIGILPARIAASASPTIAATIAIVMDYDTGEILYERNAHARHIPASMTKSLTAFIVYEEIEMGNITLECMVPVSAFASRIASGGYGVQGNHVAMRAGSYHSVETMLRLAMLPSSNGASVALAEFISGSEEAFTARMNETAAELGMYAGFLNSHGASVMHTTAYSIAILTREFISRYPDILRITAMESMYFDGRRITNTNLITRRGGQFFDSTVDGFKTGIIREAGWGHSVTAYRDGRRMIAVLMNSNSNEGRHRDALRLLDFGFAEAERRVPQTPINVTIDGMPVHFADQQPLLIGGRTLVPVAGVFQNLGFTTHWNERTRQVALHRGNDVIVITIGSNTFMVNTVYLPLDVPAHIIGGRTMLPISALLQSVGYEVRWYEEVYTVAIYAQE